MQSRHETDNGDMGPTWNRVVECATAVWLSIPSTAGARTRPISVLIRGKPSGSRAVKAVPCVLVRFARTSHKSNPGWDIQL